MKLRAKYSSLGLTKWQYLLPSMLSITISLLFKVFGPEIINLFNHTNIQEKIIVIDPGHGGKDPGCIAHDLQEKQIVLDVSVAIQKFFRTKYPDYKVILTRENDEFIHLDKRAKIANQPGVELFVSLHCNALHLSNVDGSESYVQGLETADENLEFVKRENSSVSMEELNDVHAYAPSELETHILASYTQQQNLEKSILLASAIQESIASIGILRNRGVKQAGFVVLRKVVVPSVLVELGFLSNAHDSNVLSNQVYQEKIANSIGEGIYEYLSIIKE